MAVAANADDYAATRLNIFFPGVNPTLDGQCVSLQKWFLGEMAGVVNWDIARGHGNACGRTLVNQGLAREVAYSERRRGDVVCLEYGTYGHVYIQLSGGRVFESNVNMPGTTRRLIDGDNVYSSRIGNESEAWRAGKNPHVYRLNGYNEGGEEVKIGSGDNWYWRFNRFHHQLVRNGDLPREVFNAIVGQDAWKVLESWSDHPEANQLIHWQELGQQASKDKWDLQIYGLQDTLNIANANLMKAQEQLANSVSKEELAKSNQAVADAQAEAKKAREELTARIEADAKTDEQAQGLWRSILRLFSKEK